MLYLLKCGKSLSPHPFGGRIHLGIFGMLLLQFLKTPQLLIVFKVWY